MVVREDSAGQQISLSGKVDVTTVADLRSVLHGAIDQGDGVLRVDVSTLELVDAAGLGVLLGAHRRAQRCRPHASRWSASPRTCPGCCS